MRPHARFFNCLLACLLLVSCQSEEAKKLEAFGIATGIPIHQEHVCLYVFLSDCIISDASHKKIKALQAEFEMDGLLFQAVYPSKTDKQAAKFELDSIIRLHELNFPILIDSAAELSALLGVSVAPTVLLIKKGSIQYRGAIDDEYFGLGQKKKSPEIKQYLRDAILSTNAGKKPKQRETQAIGCVFR